jgi:hypothetical protein
MQVAELRPFPPTDEGTSLEETPARAASTRDEGRRACFDKRCLSSKVVHTESRLIKELMECGGGQPNGEVSKVA